MKLSYLLPLLFLLACNNNQSKEPATEIATTPLWTTYAAPTEVKNKNIILVSGDEEYRSEEALPQLAKILSQQHGFNCTVLFAQDTAKLGTIDPNYSFNIPGLEQLAEADLMILFTRFRALPTKQMQHIENYLTAGKPVLAIRTATHAFNFKNVTHPFAHYGWNYNGDKTDWQGGFGKKILGETWHTHHGRHKHQSTRGIIATGAENHPLVNGIADSAIWGATDVYGIREPVGGDAQSIILGQTIDRKGEYNEDDLTYGMRESDDQVATIAYPDDPKRNYNPNEKIPPIVWTKSYQVDGGEAGQSVTSTIGAATDLLDEEVRRLLINASYYLLDLDVPAQAKVDLVGDYSPTPFQFHTDKYWEEKARSVSESDLIFDAEGR
ncbi:MAG: hypothetical protein AB8G22_14395 [Saprospiraceae bacterium]